MKLSQAYPICRKSINKPFKDLFQEFDQKEIIKNKGKSGQLMERLCGLKLSNTTMDFEDGELKTSELKESTAITIITDWVDDIIHKNPKPFEYTKLAKKIEHMIFMPLVKPSNDPLNWYFSDCKYICISKGTELYYQIENDYYNICKIAHEQGYKKPIIVPSNCKTSSPIIGDGFLHTTNGKYIQIRTKDVGGKKSKPIYSSILDRNVTKVSRMAFYFLARFKSYADENFK